MSVESPPPGGLPPGSHRAAAKSNISVVGLTILAVLTAGVLVLVGVGVVGWLRPHDKSTAQPSVSHFSRSPSPTPSTKPTVKPSTKPTVKPSTKPTAQPSTKPTTSPSSKPTSSPTKSTTPPPVSQAPRDYPVVVLNETRTHGLASDVAAQLRKKGWTVTGVGNWFGDIPETTVYYPNGQFSRAQRLAQDLGVTRLKPVVSGMLHDRLSVVLHDPPPY